MHQNQLLWSRVQTLIFIQGAVLASGYTLGAKPVGPYLPGPILLVIGACLTALLAMVAESDQAARDANDSLLRSIAIEQRTRIYLKGPPGTGLRLSGRWALRLVFIGFPVLDVVFAAVIQFHQPWFLLR